MARKKKNKSVVEKQEILKTFNGWTLGDLVWGKTYPLNKKIYGEIKEFHPNDKLGAAVLLLDLVNGCYKTILMSTIVDYDIKEKSTKLSRKKKS